MRAAAGGRAKDIYAGSKRLRWKDPHMPAALVANLCDGTYSWCYHTEPWRAWAACCTGAGQRLGRLVVAQCHEPTCAGTRRTLTLAAPGRRGLGLRALPALLPQGAGARAERRQVPRRRRRAPARVRGQAATRCTTRSWRRHSRPATLTEDMNGFQQEGRLDGHDHPTVVRTLIPCLPGSSFKKEKLFYHSHPSSPCSGPGQGQ